MLADEAEMHEALMTRGHVQGKDDASYLVFHPCNVVFRHHSCEPVQMGWNRIDDENPTPIIVTFTHGGGTGGDMAIWRATAHLIKHEGAARVREYLTAISGIFHQTGGDALRRFLSFDYGPPEQA